MSSPIAHSMPNPVSSQIPAPDTPGLTDVPLLDFDSSTVDSPFSGTMEPEPHLGAQTALNPEAAWFGVQPDLIPSVEPVCMASPPPPSQGFFNDFSVPASLFPLYPSPMPTYSPLPHGATTADDLKLILLGISSRLDALERVVASVSGHVTRLENGLAAICEKPGPEVAIDGLKKTIKEFTSALVLQVLGGDAPIEGSSHSSPPS